MTRSKIALLCLGVGLFTFSCEKETEIEEMGLEVNSNVSSELNSKTAGDALFKTSQDGAFALQAPENMPIFSENLRSVVTNDAVEPSECAPTAFSDVLNEVVAPFFSDPLALEYYSLYLDLNFYMSYLDTSEQYFGENGEYTNFMKKRKRDLEQFWGMPNEIRMNGQHTASLNDREKLADLYEIVGVDVNSREDAYAIADQLLAINEASPNLPESPYFAMDGFATSGNLIVIGDGIVETLSATGIDPEIVWTGILAHEWAHQVQFDNMSKWYPNGAAEDPSEATRYTELEADFLAAYYMTHKRGATYNWKRVEQFFNLFFQIGDCSFASPGHHGTPAQRMEATRLGYELAESAQKKGHILSQQEAHEYFVENIVIQ